MQRVAVDVEAAPTRDEEEDNADKPALLLGPMLVPVVAETATAMLLEGGAELLIPAETLQRVPGFTGGTATPEAMP
jgi:hypothetical protein